MKHPFMTAACIATLAFGVAACGEKSNDTSTSSPTPSTQPAPSTDAKAAPVASIASLTGESTAVTLDPGFVEALTTLKLTPGPVGDAKISKAGVATFPITGGNVDYYTPGSVSPYVQGLINHDGSGLSLTAGSGEDETLVELEDFVVDPGKSVLTGKVSVNGEVAVESAPLFFLDGRTLNPLESKDDGTAVLEGTTVKLKEEAATLLNDTFKTDALKAGLEIGVAEITVNTQSASESATGGSADEAAPTGPNGEDVPDGNQPGGPDGAVEPGTTTP